jgi:hypothetical protein
MNPIELISINSINYAFIYSCENGHLDIAKWLYTIGADIKYLTSSGGIRYGTHLDVLKWLYEMGLDIRARNDSVFAESYVYQQVDTAKWLCSIVPCYQITVVDNTIISWKIIDDTYQLYENKQYKQFLERQQLIFVNSIEGTCVICYDNNQYMVQTECNHVFCIDCMYLYKYKYSKTECPYCRQNLIFRKYTCDTK